MKGGWGGVVKIRAEGKITAKHKTYTSNIHKTRRQAGGFLQMRTIPINRPCRLFDFSGSVTSSPSTCTGICSMQLWCTETLRIRFPMLQFFGELGMPDSFDKAWRSVYSYFGPKRWLCSRFHSWKSRGAEGSALDFCAPLWLKINTIMVPPKARYEHHYFDVQNSGYQHFHPFRPIFSQVLKFRHGRSICLWYFCYLFELYTIEPTKSNFCLLVKSTISAGSFHILRFWFPNDLLDQSCLIPFLNVLIPILAAEIFFFRKIQPLRVSTENSITGLNGMLNTLVKAASAAQRVCLGMFDDTGHCLATPECCSLLLSFANSCFAHKVSAWRRYSGVRFWVSLSGWDGRCEN